MEYWLPIIYMGIMGLALLIYVILDGPWRWHVGAAG
jgi:cytochrome d ubiquinol oxidase subunit II